MDPKILTAEQMASMKALAETNLKVSEAKNLLYKLQEDETLYLVEREKKAVDRITKALEDSKKLIEETVANHKEVQEFTKMVSSFADALCEAGIEYEKKVKEYNEMNRLWREEAERQLGEIAALRKGIEEDKKRLGEEKLLLEKQNEVLESSRKRLESDQKVLELAYKEIHG